MRCIREFGSWFHSQFQWDKQSSLTSSYQRWKNGNHAITLPWPLYHDHGGTWSWSCHDDGMAATFLGKVAMIYGMITMFSMILTIFIAWSSCFPCFLIEKMDFFVIVFSHSCCNIWQNWSVFEETTPPNCQNSEIEQRYPRIRVLFDN